MIPKEAITNLSIQLEVKRRLGKDAEAEAIKLGIEALQDREKAKSLGHIINRLPSES